MAPVSVHTSVTDEMTKAQPQARPAIITHSQRNIPGWHQHAHTSHESSAHTSPAWGPVAPSQWPWGRTAPAMRSVIPVMTLALPINPSVIKTPGEPAHSWAILSSKSLQHARSWEPQSISLSWSYRSGLGLRLGSRLWARGYIKIHLMQSNDLVLPDFGDWRPQSCVLSWFAARCQRASMQVQSLGILRCMYLSKA